MKLLYCLLFSFCFLTVKSQTNFGETMKNQMIANWTRAKEYTQQYLDAMPADKYNFKPTDSMRTFAQQMLHLAMANAGLSSIGSGGKYPFTSFAFEKSPGAQSKDSVQWYVNTSYDFVIASIKNMDPSKFGETVTFDLPGGKRTETRITWVSKAFEHQTHHRGQCTVYLRLAGVTPPQEKLF